MDTHDAPAGDGALPLLVPLLPGWEIDARHVFAAAEDGANGAWFEVTVLEEGRLCLALGRVPGHGAAAARAAAAVRASVRGAFARHADLDEAWATVGTAVEGDETGGGTAMVTVLDPSGARLWYATAAQEGPTVVGSSGATRLPSTSADPLGATGGRPGPSRRVDLDGPPTKVVLSSSADAGAPHGSVPDADAPAAREEEAPVTVLVARRTAARPDRLDLSLESDASTVRLARLALEDWLTTLGAGPMDVMSLVHAAVELVTNSVEHAPVPGQPAGEVQVRAAHLDSGEVVVDVVDHGQWRTPTYDIARGRGLSMAAGLAHHLSVVTGPDGTHAQLRHQLTRPVTTEVHVNASGPVSHFDVAAAEPGVLRLHGVIANDDVARLDESLQRATQDATEQVEIDLQEVTALSPAAIAVIRDCATRPTTEGGRPSLRLVVRSGTVPHLEFERAGIDFVVR